MNGLFKRFADIPLKIKCVAGGAVLLAIAAVIVLVFLLKGGITPDGSETPDYIYDWNGDEMIDYPDFDYASDPNPYDTTRPPAVIETFVKHAKAYEKGEAVGETTIYNVNVAKIGADRTGIKDSTPVIQAAIDAVQQAGGGTVYVPEGRYRISGTISVPFGITLTGDWISPDEGGGAGEGTVFLIYDGRGEGPESSKSAFFVNGCIRNLSFWYPQQDPANIAAYPVTVLTSGMVTTMNLTFYNSFSGMVFRSSGCMILRNVYGTFFRSGIYAENAYDVPRINSVSINPDYWKNSGLLGAPSSEGEMEYIHKYIRFFLDGLSFKHYEWGAVSDIRIRYANNGIYVNDTEGTVLNLAGLDFAYVNYGINAPNLAHSVTVAESSINAQNAGIYMNANTENHLAVSNTVFASSPEVPDYAIEIRGSLTTPVSVNDCVFENWNINAIFTEGAALGITNTEFRANGVEVDAKNVTSEKFTVSGNTYNGSATIRLVAETAEPTIIAGPVASTPRYGNFKVAPYKGPANKNLFDVLDYGVASDGETDASVGIQKVLDLCAAQGGGYVVLPAGFYRLDGSITIPTGVELRSMHDFPARFELSAQCVLMVYAGRGEEEGALIYMEEGSGLRGMFIYYPEQGFYETEVTAGYMAKVDDYPDAPGWRAMAEVIADTDIPMSQVVPYPATVRLNKDTWVHNVSPINAYHAFDMTTNKCDYAVISDLQGAAMKHLITLGSGSSNVELSFLHTNFSRNLWASSRYGGGVHTYFMFKYLCDTTEWMVLGDAPNLRFYNNFNICANRQIKLVKDPITGNSFNGSMFMANMDISKDVFFGDEGSEADLTVLSSLSIAAFVDKTGDVGYIVRNAPGFLGSINLYNHITWAHTSYVARVESGTAKLSQFFGKHYPSFAGVIGNHMWQSNPGVLNIYNGFFGTGPDELNIKHEEGGINHIGTVFYR